MPNEHSARPGAGLDKEKVAEFLAMCAFTLVRPPPRPTATHVGARREAPFIMTVDAARLPLVLAR